MSCIIIGASHAGVQAAVSLRTMGYTKPITIVSKESVLPYQRPPLSKSFLQDTLPEARLWLRPEAFYEKKEIALRLSSTAVSINRAAREVMLASGEHLPYEHLILATGAKITRLPDSEHLSGVHYIRDYADIRGIQKNLADVHNIVVVGGGYVGLETAASLRKMGKHVTLLIRGERPLNRVTSQVVSDFFIGLHVRNDVIVKTNMSVKALLGEDAVKGVVCNDGTVIPADMVIAGIGVTPVQELAADCGLAIGDGVHVNAHMQTSDEHILAIGDCARFEHPLYEKSIRLESVQNATDQAKIAAATICGERQFYDSLPWFWSDQFDAKLQTAGLFDDHDSIVVRQTHDEPDNLAVFYFRNDKLIAVDAINQPKAFMTARKYLPVQPRVDKIALANPNTDIADVFAGFTGA